MDSTQANSDQGACRMASGPPASYEHRYKHLDQQSHTNIRNAEPIIIIIRFLGLLRLYHILRRRSEDGLIVKAQKHIRQESQERPVKHRRAPLDAI
ncbi:hypothetical protein TruAng_004196 [Truncatella angustata]|nr:hypothetical protein TruAng_004196 [Truncatella angustata]